MGLYRPILEFVRSRGVPTFALNAPKEWTRAVARGGLDAISDEQRAELPELELTDDEHRALVREALQSHHGMSTERFGAILHRAGYLGRDHGA